jgi:hypothetical protein
VNVEPAGTDAVKFAAPLETGTHIQKEMTVKLDSAGAGVTITHKITNKDIWPIELAPWALTIVRGGGFTIIPQEPYISHANALLPARPMVLWNYTDLSDSRWTLGKKYILLRTDENLTYAQKVGVANKRGWAGYLRDKTLFIKRFPYIEGASYPDYGCNFETFTNGSFMEVESVAPLVTLEPGQSSEHIERWFLFKDVNAGETEESLDKAISPLVSGSV